jgi:hypothetical protein
MVAAEKQDALRAIFQENYENLGAKGVHLVPAHFAALREQWQDASDEIFAFRLLCMAALYTRYSSAYVFGVEGESPDALRLYAEALLRKAHELDRGLIPEFDDWMNRLRGESGAFTCTAVLYGMQSRHLDALLGQEAGSGPLHQVSDHMIPLAWR